ncbi:MAG: hypothetical protein ACI8T1_001895 [Verrucomicrobiales bacterium]|jgi:hypothetical protein
MPTTRRHMLQQVSCGFGGLALAGLCQDQARAANPLASQPGLIPARAKRVIFVFMQGGPSQVDSFDYKPDLEKADGKDVDFVGVRFGTFGKKSQRKLMKPLWDFHQYGKSGRWVSDLFPEIGRHVDDLCFLHGLHTEGVAHGPSTLFLHTGATNLVRPSMGSWVSYGLGTENQNVPGFITINPADSKGGPRNYSNAFLPAVHQGTAIGSAGQSSKKARFRNIVNTQLPRVVQDRQFALMQALNRAQQARQASVSAADPVDAMIESYELAWRMQMNAPGLTDLSSESPSTLAMYGIGDKVTDDFGRQCLLARRMAEEGVRFIQVNYSDESPTPRWDQHSNMPQHLTHARATDKPVAGLLADLKARGLLEDTLVWWGGEFGRTPFSQNGDGRDHNPRGFTAWMAGGGVKPGFAYGATDELGDTAVDGRVHMHDLHATILHLLGLEHEKLTYRYAGRDFRLTDVHGHVVREILA